MRSFLEKVFRFLWGIVKNYKMYWGVTMKVQQPLSLKCAQTCTYFINSFVNCDESNFILLYFRRYFAHFSQKGLQILLLLPFLSLKEGLRTYQEHPCAQQ